MRSRTRSACSDHCFACVSSSVPYFDTETNAFGIRALLVRVIRSRTLCRMRSLPGKNIPLERIDMVAVSVGNRRDAPPFDRGAHFANRTRRALVAWGRVVLRVCRVRVLPFPVDRNRTARCDRGRLAPCARSDTLRRLAGRIAGDSTPRRTGMT